MKQRKHKNKKLRVWYVVIGIAALFAGLLGIGLIATAPGRAEVAALTFSNIDFDKLCDGTYTGEYHGVKDSFMDTSVEIIISSGKLVQINVIGGALSDGKQADEIGDEKSLDDLFKSVMENETLNVDAVSGATLTSKSYFKAVEAALIKAQYE